jgi:hypothetical protein
MPFCRSSRKTRRFGVDWDKTEAIAAIPRHAVVRVTAGEAG